MYGLTSHGMRRFATLTDSVAAAGSNVASEMFGAITRTVLLVQRIKGIMSGEKEAEGPLDGLLKGGAG